jgi:hypothetical protein
MFDGGSAQTQVALLGKNYHVKTSFSLQNYENVRKMTFASYDELEIYLHD